MFPNEVKATPRDKVRKRGKKHSLTLQKENKKAHLNYCSHYYRPVGNVLFSVLFFFIYSHQGAWMLTSCIFVVRSLLYLKCHSSLVCLCCFVSELFSFSL